MPTMEEVEDAVSAEFNALATSLGVPVSWGATEFDTNDLGEYFRFNMQFTGGTNPEISGRMFRRFGILSVQIFVPATTGKRRARQLAESVLATFEGQTIGGARLRNLGPVDVGIDDKWFQCNVTGEFEFDQFR